MSKKYPTYTCLEIDFYARGNKDTASVRYNQARRKSGLRGIEKRNENKTEYA